MRVVFLKPYEEFVEGQNVDMPGDSALNLVGRGFAEMAQEEKAAPKPKTLSQMNTAELQVVADAEGVDLSKSKNKKESVTIISAAREAVKE